MTARKTTRGGEKDAGPTLFEAALKRDPKLAELVPLAERMRPARARGLRRPGAPRRRGQAARERDRGGSRAVDDPLGAARRRARRRSADHRGADAGRVFVPFSAVLGGIQELREVVAAAKERRDYEGSAPSSSSTRSTASTRRSRTRSCRTSRTGTITLIGATTENPSFAVNAAAPLALQGVPPRAARRGGARRDPRARARRSRAGARRAGGRGRPEAIRGDRAARARRRAARALDARDRGRRGARRRGRRASDDRGRGRSRARQKRRSSTTRPARSTTTSSARSSSRCAAPIRTPPSTG